jgi:hypothetical protein
MWEISRLATELLDSQEGLRSVELQYIPEANSAIAVNILEKKNTSLNKKTIVWLRYLSCAQVGRRGNFPSDHFVVL